MIPRGLKCRVGITRRIYVSRGYAVAHLVEVLFYTPESLGVLFPLGSLGFLIDLILPAALWL
jgi:hypothetical protein